MANSELNEDLPPPEDLAEPASEEEQASTEKVDGIAAIKSTLAEMSKGEHMKKMAKALISDTKPLLLRVKGYGMDLEKEKIIFKDGIIAIKKNDYLRGSQLIGRLKKRLLDKEESYLLNVAASSLDDVEFKIAQAKEVSIDVADIDNELKFYKGQVNNKDFEDLEDFIADINTFRENSTKQLDVLMEGELENIIPNELEKINNLMEEAKGLELEVTDESSVLLNVKELINQRNHKEAYEKIEDVRHGLMSKIQNETAMHKRESIALNQNRLREMIGLDQEELVYLEDLINKANSALDENNFEEVQLALDAFQTKYDVLKKDHQKIGFTETINEIKADLDKLAQIGISLENADKTLQDIDGHLEANEFQDASEKVDGLKIIIKEAKKKKARRLASELLASTKKLYKKMSQTNVDIGDSKEMFQNAITAIKSQDFITGCLLLQQCSDSLSALEKEYLQVSIIARYDKAMEFYPVFAEKPFFSDSFKTKVKETLDKVGMHLADNELKLANEVWQEYEEMEEIINEKIQGEERSAELLDIITTEIEKAHELSADLSEILPTIDEGKEYLEDQIFEESIKRFELAIEMLSLKIGEQKKIKAKVIMETVITQYSGVKETYPEPESMEASLNQMVAHMENGEYDQSIELGKDLLKLIEIQEMKDKGLLVGSLFEEIQKLVDDCEKMGMDLLRPQALLYKAKVAHETEQYQRALDLAHKARDMALEAKKSHLNVRGQEHLDNLQAAIEKGMSLEIDVTDILNIMEEAKALMEQEKYIETANKCKVALLPLDERITEKLKELIKLESRNLSENMKKTRELQLDISEEKQILGPLAELKKEQKFQEVLDLLKNAGGAIQNRIIQYYKGKAIEKLEMEQNRMINLKEEGCNIEEGEVILARITELMEGEKFTDSLPILADLSKVIDKLVLDFERTKVNDHIRITSNFLNEIIEVMGGEVDLSEPTDNLTLAAEKLDGEDFDSARRLVNKARSRGDRVYYQYVIDSLLKSYDYLSEVKKIGGDISEAESEFANAKQLLEKKDYKEAIAKATIVEELTTKAERELMVSEIEKNQRIVTSVSEKLESKGVDILELREIIQKLVLDESMENISEVYQLSMEAKAMARKYRDNFKRITVENAINSGEELIEKMKEMEIDNSEILEELNNSRSLLDDKKYSESLKIVKKNREILNQRYSEKYYEILTIKIQDTKEHLEKIGKKTNLTEAQQILAEAVETLEQRDFDRCEELIEKSKRRGEKLSHTSLLMEAANILSSTGRIIDSAADESISVIDLRPKLIDASDAFENKEYSLVIDICDSIGESIDNRRTDQLASEARDALEKAKSMIEDARNIKADVKDPIKTYKEAMAAYKEKDFRVSLEMALDVHKNTTRQRDIRSVEAVVDSVKDKIEDIRLNGVDVKGAAELIARAGDALDSNDLVKAREITKNSMEVAMAAYRHHQMDEKIKRAREYISFAMDNDIFKKNYFEEPVGAEEGKCPKCGKEVPEKAMFCLWCGKRL